MSEDLSWMCRRIYRHAEPKRSERMLFRSLETGYQAFAMPSANLSSIHDHGSRIGLWVSAFEILAHPWRGAANLMSVVRLLERPGWDNSRLSRRIYSVRFGGRRHRVALAARLYKELYDTRNDFFHGNEVEERRLYPFRDKDRPSLQKLAPVLYSTALTAFVGRLRRRKRSSSPRRISKAIQRYFGS